MTSAGPGAPLSPREVANALRAELLAVRVECTALSPTVLRWHPAPGEWCVLSVLGHLIEAEERGECAHLHRLGDALPDRHRSPPTGTVLS